MMNIKSAFKRLSLKPRPKNRIFFQHLPKCGGTSLVKELQSSFLRPIHMDAISSKIAADQQDIPLFTFRESLLLYYLSQENIDCLSGHFNWSSIAYKHYGDKWVYVTILRDPVEKWFSYYFYNRHKKGDHFKTDLEIEDFLNTERAKSFGRDYVIKLSSNNNLNEAKRNLEKFSIIGILENLGPFSEQFYSTFGIRIKIPHANKNPASKEKSEIMNDPSIRSKVQEICAPNISLFQHAVELNKG